MQASEHTHTTEVQACLEALRESTTSTHEGDRDPQRMIAALQRAALCLSDTREPLAVQLRHELRAETGLSAPMIEWGLGTSLTSLRLAPLAELAGTQPAHGPCEVMGVVLAGNVFVAALRGLCLPLLVGARVLAKTASREGAFARAWQAALTQVDPAMGARLKVVQFSREDTAASAALCSGVDALSVFGDDETIAHLRRLITPGTRLIAHGHGLSAAYVTRQQLATIERAVHTAERVALDICAYDQRGCLSPHVVCVQAGSSVSPHAFAQLLAERALPSLEQLLPPSAPSLAERAARMQWQAIAAVRGELFAQTTHAVSVEPPPLRPSPGGRLISVYSCDDHTQLRELLAAFGPHLKCVGVAGSRAERAQVATVLRSFSSASVCMCGEMQTPAFTAWADGSPPLAGLRPEAAPSEHTAIDHGP